MAASYSTRPPSWDLPELREAGGPRRLIRIPQEQDVPVTPRVTRLIDSAPFRRLAGISQLGLVALVYPAANHTRFEHSLGVYRLALAYLRQLAYEPRFCEVVTPRGLEAFLVAALLHDVGHWPFCHPIEDLALAEIPAHEQFAREFLEGEEIATALAEDWQTTPQDVADLLGKRRDDAEGRLLASLLSGPIDIDKMDYLQRDSLHAGVPYGQNFDRQRLIASLCVNAGGDGLALRDKGRTAAEMMVFARYVMFSEVYWHHAVRAATAMLQRAFYTLRDRWNLADLFRKSEAEMIAELRAAAAGSAVEPLVEGLFGERRRLYKRVAQFSVFENETMYRQLARRPYPWLVRCAAAVARRLTPLRNREMSDHAVLIDAPPVHLEVQFNVPIYFPKEDRYRNLGDVSPVVRTLAQQQFDDYVKRVRVFASPELSQPLADRPGEFLPVLQAAIDEIEERSR